MSEDGGLEEVEESLRPAASCSWSRMMVACRTSSCACRASNCACWVSSRACNRWQFGQECVASAPMAAYSTSHPSSDNNPVNRHVDSSPGGVDRSRDPGRSHVAVTLDLQ